MLEGDFAPDVKVIVQGITGRTGSAHTRNMVAYGTNIVGGTAPRDADICGLPIFRTCREAVDATKASVSLAVVPPLSVLPAIIEAVEAGITTIITIAEGVPVHDAIRARHVAKAAGVRWIGASTPGIAIPDRMKIGFLPTASLNPGRLGVMAKSGTLSYEVCYRLACRGLGQSIWIGVGGDPVKGTRFSELIPVFADDDGTDALVVIGEIGGDEEEELAAEIIARGFSKPVYALIAGSAAREGVTMGHAGALIHGDIGTVATKTRALTRAGAQVFTRIQDLIDAVAQD